MKKLIAFALCILMLAAPLAAFASFGGNLSIDVDHVYSGMEKSFAEGYVPTVTDTEAILVLPLIGKTYGSKIRVSPEFPEDGPFAAGNCLFDVAEKSYSVKNGSGKTESVKAYLISMTVPLKEGFMNGNYSVTFNVSYSASYGVPGEQSFTLRVPIENGRSANASDRPNLLFVSGATSPMTVTGGDDITLTVTGRNNGSGTAYGVRLTSAAQDDGLTLTSDLNGTYIEKLEPDESFSAEFKYRVSRYALGGNHVLNVSAVCENAEGSQFSAESQYRVSVEQELKLVLEKIQFPEAVTSGDTLNLIVSVYNPSCSKAYGVRGSLNMDGMMSASIMLGDIEPQGSVQKELLVIPTTLSGSSKYGTSSGDFDMRYYDETGREYAEFQSITSELMEPMKLTDEEKAKREAEAKEQQTVSQWWVSLVLMLAVISILAASIIIARFARQMRMK